MFDILYYVFENCQQAELAQDRGRITRKLLDAGFDDSDISQAMTWLAGMLNAARRQGAPLPDANPALRAYAPRELARLDAPCRGFLLTLEQARVLTPVTRELVLERALAAAGGPLTLAQLKLVVLIVLWNQRTPASRLIAEDLLGPDVERLPN